MLLGLFASIRRVLLVHLLKLSVVLALLVLQIELHVLKVLQILVFNLLPESLLFGLCFFCPSSVLLSHSFNHVV